MNPKKISSYIHHPKKHLEKNLDPIRYQLPLKNNEQSNIKNKFKYLYENRGHRKNANVSMPRKANVMR